MGKVDIVKYLNIPYLHEGRDWSALDCYGLVRLFYITEFGFELPDYSYKKNWVETKDFSFLKDKLWQHCKKIKVYKKYCIAGFKMPGSKLMDHMGLMLDEISFLHAVRNSEDESGDIIKAGYVRVSKLTEKIWQHNLCGFWLPKELDVDGTANYI